MTCHTSKAKIEKAKICLRFITVYDILIVLVMANNVISISYTVIADSMIGTSYIIVLLVADSMIGTSYIIVLLVADSKY